MSANKPWVEKYLIPLNACGLAIRRANEYDDPQSAWDNWDQAGEMLWVLTGMNYDVKKIILCLCEMAERVLYAYEKNHPNDARLRKAVQVAKKVAEHNTKKNRAAAYEAFARKYQAIF